METAAESVRINTTRKSPSSYFLHKYSWSRNKAIYAFSASLACLADLECIEQMSSKQFRAYRDEHVEDILPLTLEALCIGDDDSDEAAERNAAQKQ